MAWFKSPVHSSLEWIGQRRRHYQNGKLSVKDYFACLGNLFLLSSLPDMETKYISAQEASLYTGFSLRRINQLFEAGQLPGMRIGNSNAIEKGAELKRLKRVKADRLAKKNGNGEAAK